MLVINELNTNSKAEIEEVNLFIISQKYALRNRNILIIECLY